MMETQANASQQPQDAPKTEPSKKYRLVLASSSPRRRELLGSLGLTFDVIKPDVDEEAFHLDHLLPADVVKFLSRTKAQEVFKHHTDALVIGADTIVVLNDQVFGKPKNTEDAFRMLNALQGNVHEVYSGITVFNPNESPEFPPLASDALCTQVRMRPLTPDEIRTYIATGEPMDKAGAYAIQGFGSTLIEKIDGCYFNVVGMSLYLLERLFEQLGQKLVL
jgi:septum formation protein